MRWRKKSVCSRTSLGMEYSLRRERKKKLHKHENFPLANRDRLQTCSHAHWASPLSSPTRLCSFWDLVLVICRTLIIGNKASSYHSIYGVLRSNISDEVKGILSVWGIRFGTISLPVIMMTVGEEVYSGNKWQQWREKLVWIFHG